MRKRSRTVPIILGSKIRARTPAFARLFNPATADEIRFTNLKPLAAGSAWSAVAMLCPAAADSCGIVSQCQRFAAGAHAFTVSLKDGAICVESGAAARVSQLVAPLHEWSWIGIASTSDGVRVYLRTGDSIEVEDLPGLLVGGCAPDVPLIIGRLGNSFSGSIAFVCLYSDKLPDDTMRAICTGQLDPHFAPKLCFAWQAPGMSDMDSVSRKVPLITGTRIIPVSAATQNARRSGAALPTPKAAAAEAEAPRPEPAPAPPARLEIDHAAASRSSLFRELGLVPEDP